MSKITIESLDRGYLITRQRPIDTERKSFQTLDEVFKELLFQFESICEEFYSTSYGKVEITRGTKDNPPVPPQKPRKTDAEKLKEVVDSAMKTLEEERLTQSWEDRGLEGKNYKMKEAVNQYCDNCGLQHPTDMKCQWIGCPNEH